MTYTNANMVPFFRKAFNNESLTDFCFDILDDDTYKNIEDKDFPTKIRDLIRHFNQERDINELMELAKAKKSKIFENYFPSYIEAEEDHIYQDEIRKAIINFNFKEQVKLIKGCKDSKTPHLFYLDQCSGDESKLLYRVIEQRLKEIYNDIEMKEVLKISSSSDLMYLDKEVLRCVGTASGGYFSFLGIYLDESITKKYFEQCVANILEKHVEKKFEADFFIFLISENVDIESDKYIKIPHSTHCVISCAEEINKYFIDIENEIQEWSETHTYTEYCNKSFIKYKNRIKDLSHEKFRSHPKRHIYHFLMDFSNELNYQIYFSDNLKLNIIPCQK